MHRRVVERCIEDTRIFIAIIVANAIFAISYTANEQKCSQLINMFAVASLAAQVLLCILVHIVV